MRFGNVNNEHSHDYDLHGCCRICGHLTPGGIAHREAMENRKRREDMDKLVLMFHQAEAEFTCNVKNGGECLYHSCNQHKERELARYLVNHGVKLEEENAPH